jgi:hypothetical protein
MKASIIHLSIAFVMIIACYSCAKEFSCEGCMQVNLPPLAVSGPDQVIKLPVDSVLLDGSASSDPDGNIALSQWTKIAGPASFDIVSPDDSSTRVRSLVEGIYQFELKVTDDGGLSSMDTVKVTVQALNQQNQPPVACAGQDQSITLPVNNLSLDGRCSADPDNDIASYLWTKLSGPASYQISNPDQPLTPVTGLTEGSYVFQLTVRDRSGLSSIDTARVTVYPLPLVTDSLDVFVAGNENSVPKYWKNGQGVELNISNLTNGHATAIALDGNDVYVAGWEGDFLDMSKNRAKYWKNGQEVFLTGATGGGANAIVVSGGDVYVAGYDMQAGIWIAKYWKNGVAVALTDGSKMADATDIAVVGGDVYVSGYDGDVAKIWRNGQLVGPANAPFPSYAFGMTIVGADVYLAGAINGKAAYWKNDQAFTLTTGEGSSRSIFLSGTDVYVAGTKGDYYSSLALYWKNGQETILSGSSEAMIASSILVMGNDVYVTGFEYNTNYRGGYWKNGQFVQLGSRNAQPSDILVKRR